MPRRGTTGIEAWQPQWMCMRCHNELQLEHICVPDPDPRMPPVLDAYALGGRPRETTGKVGLQPLPLCALCQTTRARGCPTM